MIASSTNASSSRRGPSCSSQRNTSTLVDMTARVATGNRREGMLSRMGSTNCFLSAASQDARQIPQHRQPAGHPHQNLRQPAPLRVSSGAQMNTDETNALIEQRKAKLADLRERAIDPFRNKRSEEHTS